jgi:hypothetical protein
MLAKALAKESEAAFVSDNLRSFFARDILILPLSLSLKINVPLSALANKWYVSNRCAAPSPCSRSGRVASGR